jgi:hypothetical protein
VLYSKSNKEKGKRQMYELQTLDCGGQLITQYSYEEVEDSEIPESVQAERLIRMLEIAFGLREENENDEF